ncbi:PulJ/GspJ family protein [Bosea sp. NPDC055332]
MSDLDHCREAGFSLLDTLVALAVTAFVGVAATAAIFLAMRTYEGVRDTAARTTFLLDTDRTLRSLLDRLAVSSIERYQPSFSGTAAGFTLVSAGPEALLADSVRPISVRVDSSGSTSTLSLERADANRHDGFAFAHASLRFSYFGAPSRDEEERWLERWERRDAMPRALRLIAKFAARPSEVELVYRLSPQPLAFCLTEQCLRTAGQ